MSVEPPETPDDGLISLNWQGHVGRTRSAFVSALLHFQNSRNASALAEWLESNSEVNSFERNILADVLRHGTALCTDKRRGGPDATIFMEIEKRRFDAPKGTSDAALYRQLAREQHPTADADSLARLAEQIKREYLSYRRYHK